VSPSGTNDVFVAVPTWHPLWAVLTSEASTNSIRITAGDGYTQLAYELTDAAGTGAWSTASKDGGIEIDDAPFIDTTTCALLWLYYGNASASSAAGTVALTAAETGYLYSGVPRSAAWHVDARRSPPGATLVDIERAKTSTETVFYWIRVNAALPLNAHVVDGVRGLAAPYGATYTIETGGAAQAAMLDVTKQRWVETEQGELLLRLLAKAGTDGTDYTVWATLVTGFDHSSVNNSEQVVEPVRFLLKVNDPDET